MGKIKAIIFDCDGTLIDSEEAHFLAWKHAFAQQGSDLKLHDYLPYVGKASNLLAEIFGQQYGINPLHIFKDKVGHYHTLQAKGLPPIQSTIDFFHQLIEARERLGIKIGLASAATKEEIAVNLKTLGIEHHFDIILSGQADLTEYSDPEGVNKPKPYIYLHAAKVLGLSPSECVVVEDSYIGVSAGVSAGCLTVAVPNPFTSHQDFSQAHFKIDSFKSLTVDPLLNHLSTLQSIPKNDRS